MKTMNTQEMIDVLTAFNAGAAIESTIIEDINGDNYTADPNPNWNFRAIKYRIADTSKNDV